MNRLSPLSGSKPGVVRGWSAEDVELSVATTAQDGGLKHQVFAPLHYEPNYAYPLLVWLHGGGADEQQLVKIMPFVSMRNYVAVAPQCPAHLTLESNGHESDGLWQAEHATEAAHGILDCIAEVERRYHVARNRIFLAGYRDGGEMALRIALEHPRQFAGVVSVNGAFPRLGNPLARLAQARGIPILITHGHASREYPLDQLCEDLRLFHAAGMNVTLRQYPCADEIHSQMLRDLNIWLMEQVTGQELFQVNYITPDSAPRPRDNN